jgi:hypothetical protein
MLTREADNELIDRRARNSPQGEHIRGNRVKLLRLDYLVYVLDFSPQRRCKAAVTEQQRVTSHGDNDVCRLIANKKI